jgi:hypothetical protein
VALGFYDDFSHSIIGHGEVELVISPAAVARIQRQQCVLGRQSGEPTSKGCGQLADDVLCLRVSVATLSSGERGVSSRCRPSTRGTRRWPTTHSFHTKCYLGRAGAVMWFSTSWATMAC